VSRPPTVMPRRFGVYTATPLIFTHTLHCARPISRRARRDGRRRGVPLPRPHRLLRGAARHDHAAAAVAAALAGRGGPTALGVRPQRHALPRQRRTRRRHLGARRAGGRRGRGPSARLRGRRRRPGRLARTGERAARAGVHVPRRGAAMTTDTQQAPATPSERTFSWQGVRTVLTLELRQRVRSTRWKVALVVWFAIVGFVAALLPGLVGSSSSGGGT